MDFPEPTAPRSSRAAVLLGYLDFFRTRVSEKLRVVPPGEVYSSRLPSGWTPIQLAKHLTFVERRWFEWGFDGADVGDPWGDQHDGRWFVAENESLAEVLSALDVQGERTRAIVSAHDLADIGRPGPRWDGADPASLERVALHVLQEYARHLGQLDVVVELAGGETGE